MSQRWSAQGLIDLVLDDGTFESWDQPIDISGHSDAYQDELRRRVGASRAPTSRCSPGVDWCAGDRWRSW